MRDTCSQKKFLTYADYFSVVLLAENAATVEHT